MVLELAAIAEEDGARLDFVSTDWLPRVTLKFDQRSNQRDDEIVELAEFINLKGVKALGNRLTKYKLKSIDPMQPLPHEDDVSNEELDDDPEPQGNGDGGSESMSEEVESGMDDQEEAAAEKEEASEPKPAKADPEPPAEKKEKSSAPTPSKPSIPASEEKEKQEQEAPAQKPSDKKEPKPANEPKKPSKDDDNDTFGAGSQITLEL